MESSRMVWPKLAGNQSTTPVANSPSAPRETAKKNSFWPALYFPTSGAFPLNQPRSLGSSFISLTQWKNIANDARKKATPAIGCSQRQTESPPNKWAIQPKIGVQMGRPVKRQMKKKSATLQCKT